MRDVLENVGLLDHNTGCLGDATEHEACGQIANKRRESNKLDQQAKAEGKGNPDRFRHGVSIRMSKTQ